MNCSTAWHACSKISCVAVVLWLCSRVLVGALSAEQLDARTDENGTTLLEASTAAGYGGESHQARPHHFLLLLQAQPIQKPRSSACPRCRCVLPQHGTDWVVKTPANCIL